MRPAIRRGLLVAAPIGVALLTELELDDAVAGGLGTAALIAGFVAFDAPARVRVRWQLLTAPLIGLAAALGVLSATSDVTAIAAMAVVATAAGYCVAVSRRLAIAGMSCVLALLIAQGVGLGTDETLRVLAIGIAGGLMQAFVALLAWALRDRDRELGDPIQDARAGFETLTAAPSLRSPSVRHALRFGTALGIGVAIYRIAGIEDHGYWVPLTILFVLKPGADETSERIAMRAAGTIAGLILATALAELLGDDLIPTTIVLTAAAACAYGLLAIEYALFTTAITVYVVLLTDTLGFPAFAAADARALGTLLGITVAALAFRVWGDLDDPVPESNAR